MDISNKTKLSKVTTYLQCKTSCFSFTCLLTVLRVLCRIAIYELQVIDTMSAVLEVTSTEIRDAVKRDRCDWLAAVFNLLIDQPEGRYIIQQLMNEDPEDQLVDAAHYQGSMEHFRLSQAGKTSNNSPIE